MEEQGKRGIMAILLIICGIALLAGTGLLACVSAAPVVEPEYTPAPEPPDDERQVGKKDFLSGRDDWKALGAVSSWGLEGSQADFLLDDGTRVLLSFPAPDMYRLRFDPEGGDFEKPGYAVLEAPTGLEAVEAEEAEGIISLKAGALTLRVSKAAFSLSVERGGRLISADSRPAMRSGTRSVVFRGLEPEDRIYGLGEKTGPLQKSGASWKLWNTDAYGYGNSTDELYMAIPFFLRGGPGPSWGILFDNPRQSFFDFGAEKEDELSFGATGGGIDYWFMAGDDAAAVHRAYASLTGKPRLPPAWALGFQQSRYSYVNESQVREVAARLRQEAIPADVIYFDIDFMNGNRSFTHNAVAFPDPAALLADLEAMGFKAITIIDPGIKVEPGYSVYDSGLQAGAFLQRPDGSLAKGQVWPGICVFPDYGKPETDAWWGAQYKPILDLGFDAIWNDMNEPSVFRGPGGTLPLTTVHNDVGARSSHAKMHNLYGMLMARASLEGMDALRPGQRSFVLSRAGYAGIQRYAATWTGDNTASWDHLKLNLTMVLGLGLSGVPLSGADVGGYKGNPDPELYARWMELGSLLPFFRVHSEKGTAAHEPWAFGEEVLAASKKAVELRYRLMPYLYGLAREASLSGDPLARPLFWHFPEDPAAWEIEDEFLLGPSLLAAPVLERGAVKRSVYFPAGSAWRAWESPGRWEGGTRAEIEAPLGRIPLFVREGAIVATRDVEQWLGQKADAPVILTVVPGQAATASLYEDDGRTMAYQEGAYRELGLSLSEMTASGFELRLEARHIGRGFTPRSQSLWLELRLDKVPKGISLDGKALSIQPGTRAAGRTGALWDAQQGILALRVAEASKAHRLILTR